MSLSGVKDDSYSNTHLVRSYGHNLELQRSWAWAFLAFHMRELKGDANEYLRLLSEALRPDGIVEACFGRIEIEAKCLD